MISKLDSVIDIYQRKGISKLILHIISYLLQKVELVTPYITTDYNDIAVLRYDVSDVLNPGVEVRNRPFYEDTIISELRSIASRGDRIVILGGGVGVTTVHAAQLVGDSGKILVYEASEDMIDIHKRTVCNNHTPASIDTEHAVIGSSKNIWGKEGDNEYLAPASLPEADIYVIDIEGAELDVIPHLSKPDNIIIETHGTYGSPSEKVRQYLRGRGYSVRDAGVAEPRQAAEHERRDIRVLVGTR
jgi:hypothetical protein